MLAVLMRELVEQSVSMQEIAVKSGMGYSLFRKLFKERMLCAPVQYFLNLKIQKAVELLTTTTISVKEIAYQLSFVPLLISLLVLRSKRENLLLSIGRNMVANSYTILSIIESPSVG